MGKRRTTIHDLRTMKESGRKIAMVTSYDYTSAKILDGVGSAVAAWWVTHSAW